METKQTLERLIKTALDKVYKEQPNLIKTNSSNDELVHNNERAIVFRFGHYLIELIRQESSLTDYVVDVEYNRLGYEIKRLIANNVVEYIYPDLIVHKRVKKDNLLVIEFKTWWNSNQTEDEAKIRKLIDPNGEYNYKYGLLVLLGKEEPILEWIT